MSTATGTEVIQLKKKEPKTPKPDKETTLKDNDKDNVILAQLKGLLKTAPMEIIELMINEDDDKCCPEEERSSQASDYFIKPSNVDISPPPESSETVLSRQQEFLKHYEEIELAKDQADCLTVIMQDALYELLILTKCNRILLEEMINEAKKEVESKGSPRMNEDGTPDETQFNSEALKLTKMDGDKQYLTDIAAKVYMDLKINKSFPTLLVHLSDLSIKSYKVRGRENHYKELKSTLRKLQAKLATDIEGHKNKLLQFDRDIYGLKDDIDDITWNNDIKIRYMYAWQDAQQEQHSLAIERTEWEPLGTIKHYEDLIKKENRIHKEIINYFQTSIEDYTDDIEHWMEKFDNELDQLDMDIRMLKEKIDLQKDETNALKNLKDEHKREMDEYQSVLDERERLKNLHKKQEICAIILQSWWRGVMTRKLVAKMRKKARKGGKGKGKKK